MALPGALQKVQIALATPQAVHIRLLPTLS
jgi:hypothetical protein